MSDTHINTALDEPKNVEVHVNEQHRKVMLRIINVRTGEIESTVFFNPEQAAHHTRAMFQVCQKIKATGTHMILPGDPEFRMKH